MNNALPRLGLATFLHRVLDFNPWKSHGFHGEVSYVDASSFAIHFARRCAVIFLGYHSTTFTFFNEYTEKNDISNIKILHEPSMDP